MGFVAFAEAEWTGTRVSQASAAYLTPLLSVHLVGHELPMSLFKDTTRNCEQWHKKNACAMGGAGGQQLEDFPLWTKGSFFSL
jgi:hypothetical protein